LRAIAWAHLGDEERTQADVDRALEPARLTGQEIQTLQGRAALAVLALSRGDTRAAHEQYVAIATAMERRGDGGIAEWWLLDEVETRVAEGDVDEAERRLGRYAVDAMRNRRPRFLAYVARANALIAHARGDTDAALRYFDEALAHHEQFDDDYQLARTLFALGSMQRGLRRKAAAAESLGRARELFERMGAVLWAERARSERSRIGGRAASNGALTETERQIASLVATGRSNADVARALSITPKTVEWNLSKVYRKLRVSSRTELAAKLPDRL
jgi:DNA-binding CsgD family transcriptional regulator